MLKYILILFLPGLWAIAQTVSSIDIMGSQVTVDYVILREIQHPVHVQLDSALAEDDRERIENLGLFSTVEWEGIPLEDGTVKLRYHVIESTRIFPILAPTYEEDTGWSIVFGGIVKNLRGRNESLVIGGLIGGIDAYGIEFNDPWIVGDHVSVGLQVGKHVSDHLFLPYERQTSSFELNVGRYFGYQRRVSIGFELEEKNFVNDSTTVKFKYFAPQGSITYDTRDIYTDPSKGIFIFHQVQFFKYLNIKGQSVFWTQSYSAFYSPIKGKHKTTLGGNITINTTHGDRYKELFFFGMGGAYSIRGWKIEDRILYESGNQHYRFGYFDLFSSMELRQTVIPRFAVQRVTPFGPIKTEMGLQGILFLDGGIVGEQWGDLFQKKPMFGAGFGVRFPVALAGNLRLDYGWSFYDGKAVENSFHFSVGQKF